ncbi:MAG: FAD-dependent oxidoreductase [Longicatena sp.]
MNSYWIQNGTGKAYPSLQKDINVNIVIIGAGLTGLSTAYYLSKREKDMIVVEADTICYGASGRNTGKLTAQHGPIYKDLMKNYDLMIAKQYYHANVEAIRSMESIIKEHDISCGFNRRDTMLYTRDSTMVSELQEEYQAYLDIGIDCKYVENVGDSYKIEAGLIMHNQAKFDPYQYGLGLSDILDERNIPIYEHSPVKTMVERGGHSYELHINDYHVHAHYVIFASQFPFIDHAHFYFTKMYCEQESIAYMENFYNQPEIMMVNIEKPLHTYNIYKDKIIVGGNSYKSGQAPEITHTKFMRDIRTLFPKEKVEYVWSSQDYITFDHIPFIGKLDKKDDHVLFASGFNKWGNSTSNIAGKLLSAYVLKLHSPYHMLYSPQRLSSLFTIPFVKENLNVAYEFIKSKFKYEDDEYPMLEEGKVMQIDGHSYGVYRDEHDELFIVDITCPHLGCVCSFNSVDKTWDCPCHGSRFSFKGDIIKGPATHCLNKYGEGLNEIDPHILK